VAHRHGVCASTCAGPFTLALVGDKGSGKTTCALQLAHWLQAPACAGPEHGGAPTAGAVDTDPLSVALVCGSGDGAPEAEAHLLRLAARMHLPVITRSSLAAPQDEVGGDGGGVAREVGARGAEISQYGRELSSSEFLTAARAEATRRNVDVLIVDCGPVSSEHEARRVLEPCLLDTDLLLFVVDMQLGWCTA